MHWQLGSGSKELNALVLRGSGIGTALIFCLAGTWPDGVTAIVG